MLLRVTTVAKPQLAQMKHLIKTPKAQVSPFYFFTTVGVDDRGKAALSRCALAEEKHLREVSGEVSDESGEGDESLQGARSSRCGSEAGRPTPHLRRMLEVVKHLPLQ